MGRVWYTPARKDNMTRKIKLSYGSDSGFTPVSNIFIDNYLADSHGSYIKVYIYLLRCLSDPELQLQISIANISEKLDETEKDIVKALKYWEQKKLLKVTYDADGEVSSISVENLNSNPKQEEPIHLSSSSGEEHRIVFTPVKEEIISPCEIIPVNISKPNYSARQIEQFKEFDDFRGLINYIEAKIGRPLTTKELQTPSFLYESLALPASVISFLYDYAYGKEKKSSAYIEKVAKDWSTKGINTVELAKREILTYSMEYKAVLSALGLSRPLGDYELDLLNRWVYQYKMDTELLKEACSRTLATTGEPKFAYVEGILSKWAKAGVKNLNDVASVDIVHENTKARIARTNSVAAQKPSPKNQFAQFTQRQYTAKDFEEIENRKLGYTNALKHM